MQNYKAGRVDSQDAAHSDSHQCVTTLCAALTSDDSTLETADSTLVTRESLSSRALASRLSGLAICRLRARLHRLPARRLPEQRHKQEQPALHTFILAASSISVTLFHAARKFSFASVSGLFLHASMHTLGRRGEHYK